jgi:hypothetical protein
MLHIFGVQRVAPSLQGGNSELKRRLRRETATKSLKTWTLILRPG